MKYVDKEYTNGDVEYASGNGEINFYDKNKGGVMEGSKRQTG